MTRLTAFLLVPALAALAACAGLPAAAPACGPGRQALGVRPAVFRHGDAPGRGLGGGLARPRRRGRHAALPDGLTAWPASGRWKPASGALVPELSWVLNVVHAPDATSDAVIAAIIGACKQRFHQESVLRVTSAVCVAF